jgi:hypothetical protein
VTVDGECAAHGYRGTVDWGRDFPAHSLLDNERGDSDQDTLRGLGYDL